MKNQVRFCCVRVNQVQQFENWHDDLVGNHILIDAFTGETLPDSFVSYVYLELVTTGWSNGARTRVRKLTCDRALAYINKLHAGNWIDDATYDTMYSATDALLWKLHLGPWAWTVEPYQFSDLS